MNQLSIGTPNLFLKKTDPEFLASSIEKCYDTHFLKKLHACIFTSGLESNIFLGSKLINSYAQFRLLSESRWVFGKIINNNLSLWNSVLVGHFRARRHDEVLRIYSDLRRRKIGVHSSAFTFILKSCVQLGGFGTGRAVHSDAIKFGLDKHPFVGSSLIGFYSNNGDIEDAVRVFDDITKRDIVVYTSMVTGYAQVGDCRAYEAFRVASHMQKDELEPNRVTLVSLLQAAAQLRALEYGESVHGYSIRRGIGCLDEVFETSLLDMYVKCGSPKKATAVFDKMSTKTVGCWNAVIAGHLQLGQPLEALDLFCLMVQGHQEFDVITLANVVLSCAALKLFNEGKSIYGYMLRTGIQIDAVACTAVIDLYMKCKDTVTAWGIFDRMETKDVVSFNVMMGGYLHNGFACEAIEAFHEMVRIGIRPNQSTILSILSAFSHLKGIRGGTCVHGYVLKHNFGSSTDVANQMIYVYVNCGCIDSARQVFSQIKYKDLVSWTSMMMGYVNHGHVDQAMTLFRLMQKENLNPDSVTLICLLEVFSLVGSVSGAKEILCRVLRLSMEKETPVMNSLLHTFRKCGELELTRNLFEQMDERCLVSWNTMIAAYGMLGNCALALALFDQMKKEKVVPNEVTFTSLLSSCSHAGLVEEGLRIFRSMKEEYSILPNEWHYGCIVDLLSRAGLLEEAYNFWKCLPPPVKENASLLNALLAACRIHGNAEMGEVIGRQLLNLKPENSRVYGMVSSLYAEGEKWNDAARIRDEIEERGLKGMAGYSIVEAGKLTSETSCPYSF